MIYRLLGALEVRDGDRLLELPGGHTLVVLAALLINANHRVSGRDLLRAAWGDPDVQMAQLHKAVYALRALLKPVGGERHLVTHARHGYELRLSDNLLDMLAFDRLVREAEAAGKAGRVELEIDLLRRALRLWRGKRPLSNVPSRAFENQAGRLEQRRKRAAVRLFDMEIVSGSHEQIVDQLHELADYYPTDERLCEQLMIALYRCRHATDATAAYEVFKGALDRETGAEPVAAMRDLNYAISNGNGAAVTEAEAAIARRVGAAVPRLTSMNIAVPRQLPPSPAEFVGRSSLVAEAEWLFGRPVSPAAPVLVVSGAGGIGKTAMAVTIAHGSSRHYPDGQLYAELRGTTDRPADPAEVLAQFLRSFGVATVPETLAERAALFRTLTADRRVLLLLDDAADEAQVRDLIPANRGCAVLVTARRRLPAIHGAHHLPPLEPLDDELSASLFRRLVEAASVDLGADLDGIDRIVRLCGGLPLALRVAAALRVQNHLRPTAELADRLAEQGPEAFAYGDANLARTIGAGFDLLGGGAQRLFLGLGLLRMPCFGLWTAAAILDGTGVDPGEALAELAAFHMIETTKAGGRFRFHDLTREYAERRSGPPDVAVPTRAYEALLTLARRAHRALYGGDFEVVHSDVPDRALPQSALVEVDAAAMAWFDTERDNIRAAVEHCATLGLTGICWDLAVSAHECYTLGGYFDDWYATHVTALHACRVAGDRRGEGVMLTGLGQPALVASRRLHAGEVSRLADLGRAVDLLGACGDVHGRAIALRTLGNALRRRGHLARPLELFAEALAGYEASHDTVGLCLTLRFIGHAHLDRGEHEEAVTILRRAEGIAAELDERVLAQTRYWIGQACLAMNDLTGARAAFAAVREVFVEPKGLGHAYALQGLAEVAARTGAYAEAGRLLDIAAGLAREGADAVLEGRVQLSTAALHAALGRHDRQISALTEAALCFAGCDAINLEAQALATLARAHADRGAHAAAAAAWARADEIYRSMELPEEDRIHRGPPRAHS